MLADPLRGRIFRAYCQHPRIGFPFPVETEEKNAISTNRFPLPGERVRVRGREYEARAIRYRERAPDKVRRFRR
ncbi:hypothetical protein D3C85_1530110 [compost metagenome]